MTKKEQRFQETVLSYYHEAGRHHLPWRTTTNPYRILVSEVMLQQTQVDRVVPKYRAFLKQFPSVRALASAPLGDVLVQWQGLGYNRRARSLQAAAAVVVRDYRGQFPRTYEALQTLPGVGPYTAAAVMAFAYNEAVPLIETNVRTVYIHHFFRDQTDITDAEILERVAATMPPGRAREWYAALMDYGAHLKRTVGNLNTQSKHYTKQSTFKGSDRQVRGAILRLLVTGTSTRPSINKQLSAFTDIQVDAQLDALVREGLVTERGRLFMLPD